MKIVLLMAGGSEAFHSAGYVFPKSLIEVHGTPVLQHVINALSPLLRRGDHLVVLVPAEEAARFHLGEVIRLLVPNATVIEVLGATAGAACTALLAIDYLDDGDSVLVVNGDQIIEGDPACMTDEFDKRNLDGGIVVFRDIHPRWSFVKCDAAGLVVEAAEKRPISNLATAGLYYFRRGADFIAGACDMIRKDAQVGGSYFVCPIYNELILRQKRIGIVEVSKSAYWSLANPQGVRAYEEALSLRRQGSIQPESICPAC